jgi:uncharacterized protein
MTVDAAARPDKPLTGFAARLQGWGPLGIVAFLLVALGVAITPPAGALIVVLWVWLSKTSWRAIGYVRPKSWLGAIVIGILFGVALKLAMKAVVMPLIGSPPSTHAFQELHTLNGALEFAVYAVIGAGWGEETVFRGYLFDRFGKLFGTGASGKVLVVLLATAIFAVLHWAQGMAGIEQAAIVGLIFGTIFAITGRLVMLMIAHAAFDLTAAAVIFFNLDTPIAHLVFK